MKNDEQGAAKLQKDWSENPRWKGVQRPYSAVDVVRLRGSVHIEHSLARHGAEKFWRLLHSEPVTGALGCMTGNQAVQAVQAGLKAIYCSGWQVAGDANSAGEMYPDQSLYPVDSVPRMVERINNALLRTDQIHHMNGKTDTDWIVPIVADAEAGFGGNLNAFELTKSMIKAGAAAVHFEDQLSSAKKCGHMGGKVLVSTEEAINKLVAARLAADVLGVPTLVIARTDADAANLLLSDHDPRDARFLTGERSAEGFFYVNAGPDQAIDRGLSYAPYADMIWCETSTPGSGGSPTFRRGDSCEISGQVAVLQLLPILQLAGQAHHRADEVLARGTGRDGISLPIHHAGRLACLESFDVRTRVGLPGGRHARLLAAATARIRVRRARDIAAPSTRHSSVPATSTRFRRPSRRDNFRRGRCMGARKKNNSRPCRAGSRSVRWPEVQAASVAHG